MWKKRFANTIQHTYKQTDRARTSKIQNQEKIIIQKKKRKSKRQPATEEKVFVQTTMSLANIYLINSAHVAELTICCPFCFIHTFFSHSSNFCFVWNLDFAAISNMILSDINSFTFFLYYIDKFRQFYAC